MFPFQLSPCWPLYILYAHPCHHPARRPRPSSLLSAPQHDPSQEAAARRRHPPFILPDESRIPSPITSSNPRRLRVRHIPACQPQEATSINLAAFLPASSSRCSSFHGSSSCTFDSSSSSSSSTSSTTSLASTSTQPTLLTMATKGRSTPRVVCCAIPIARSAGKVLVVTSRKRPERWVCEYSLFFLSTLPPARHTRQTSHRPTDRPLSLGLLHPGPRVPDPLLPRA